MTFTDIIIRPARPEDIPRLCDLLEELFTREADFEPDIEKQAKGLIMLITAPSGVSLVLVAVSAGTVVGMASVQTLVSTAEGGRVGLVEDVIVDRKYRRMGVGTLLLRGIVDWSRKARFRRLQLLADVNNRQALDFYESRNWNFTRLICLRKRL